MIDYKDDLGLSEYDFALSDSDYSFVMDTI